MSNNWYKNNQNNEKRKYICPDCGEYTVVVLDGCAECIDCGYTAGDDELDSILDSDYIEEEELEE